MKKNIFFLLVIFSVLLISGVRIFFIDPKIPTPKEFPDESLQAVLEAFKSQDVSAVKKMTTEKGFAALQSLVDDKDWRHSLLFIESKKWNLDNSPTIWPILKQWASTTKVKEKSWMVYQGSSAEMYPRFSDDDALTLLFILEKDNIWRLNGIVMSIAE